jgi:sulfoxide reductase heme-binding subunit YedZ
LAVSLLLGPLNLILRRKNPISTYIRRDIGIFGGVLGMIHSVVGLFMHFTGKPWLYFLEEVGDGLIIRIGNFGLANYTGLFGALILILLLIISNDYSLGKLKAVKWKNLQRSTYPMFLLVIAHSIFYRLNANKEDLIIFLYLPMFFMVLTFQLIGIWLKTSRHV